MNLPKIHLHCHLEGTLAPETFREHARREGMEVSEPVYTFHDFPGFLRIFMAVCKALRKPGDYARLAREFAADARKNGVIYGEIFVSPSVWAFFHPELDVREALEAVLAELRAADLHLSLILDVTRNLGPESAMQTTKLAASLRNEGVIGIGLGGDEARFPAELFQETFAYARSQGLRTVAHAGEAAGAQSVRAAVEVLGAERIGHGVRAVEDPRVLEMLAVRRIAVEVCPTSNFLTGVVARDRPHPLRELRGAGIPIAIDADDPALFGTSIDAEYRYVAEMAGSAALLDTIGNAIEASFASDALKDEMRATLKQASSVVE